MPRSAVRTASEERWRSVLDRSISKTGEELVNERSDASADILGLRDPLALTLTGLRHVLDRQMGALLLRPQVGTTPTKRRER
jgi:hypothetical protein